jgi:hypothetical protein
MNRILFCSVASQPRRCEMIQWKTVGRVAVLAALAAFAVGGVAAA